MRHFASTPFGVVEKPAFKQLGIDPTRFDYLVALAGNPNTGKSTVFNALTGLRQHTGNWPGKTVARAEGIFFHEDKKFKVVDLPGAYSLLATTVEEEIARDFLVFAKPDAIVVVVDATTLERNLNLVLQILDISDRVVLCLNLMDEARRRGMSVDASRLQEELGVPVVPTVANAGKGIKELKNSIYEIARGKGETHPRRVRLPEEIEAHITELAEKIAQAIPGIPNARWIALRLLDGDATIARELRNGQIRRWVDVTVDEAHVLKAHQVDGEESTSGGEG
ncbi:MAG: 50S ribosome-binding GTPase [Fimbriimonadales bacterium]|nr:50S ribosome-binding GTPase [Fimbriimonadales bacterium]